jgi:hypothetical protein
MHLRLFDVSHIQCNIFAQTFDVFCNLNIKFQSFSAFSILRDSLRICFQNKLKRGKMFFVLLLVGTCFDAQCKTTVVWNIFMYHQTNSKILVAKHIKIETVKFARKLIQNY